MKQNDTSTIIFLTAGADPEEISLVAGVADDTLPVTVEAKGDLGGPVIRNVALLTAGIARPLGGEPFEVDGVALARACDLINAAGEAGVTSHLTHPKLQEGAFSGYVDSALWLVGQVNNARVVGGQARGDLHLGDYADNSPQGKLATYLSGVAAKRPQDIGMSIVGRWTFDPPTGDDGPRLGRLHSAIACDVVGVAGGNPNGLLAGTPPAAPIEKTQAATGTAAKPTAGEHEMKFNKAQMAYLTAQGLKDGATDAEITVFLSGFKAEQVQHLNGLATPASTTTTTAGDQTSLAGAGGGQVTDAQRRTIGEQYLADDKTRRDGIVALAKEHKLPDAWAQGLCDRGASVQEAKRLVELAGTMQLLRQPASSVNVGEDRDMTSLRPALVDTFLTLGRVPLAEFDPVMHEPRWATAPTVSRQGNGQVVQLAGTLATRTPHERTREFIGRGGAGFAAKRYLRTIGLAGWEELSEDQALHLAMNKFALADAMGDARFLAMGTSDFPGALDISLRVTIRTLYWQRPIQPVWQRYCSKVVNPDYRAWGMVTMGDIPDLLLAEEGEDLRYAAVKDNEEKITVNAWRRGYRFTRQMLKNDIRRAFETFPQGVVRTAIRKENLLPIALLVANPTMSDGNALFCPAHNNIATAGSLGGLGHITFDADGVARLQAARNAMLLQTGMNPDQDGDGGSAGLPMAIEAAGLIVPVGQDIAAGQVLRSATDPSQANPNVINPFSPEALNGRAAFPMGVHADAKLALSDADAWYAFADPADVPCLTMAFLQGEEAPIVATEIDFGTDDLKIKVEHNLGCAASDFRGMFKNPGH
jgi:hypothetical protein